MTENTVAVDEFAAQADQACEKLEKQLGFPVYYGCLFYEGDDPEGFAAATRADFGFDPAADPDWGERFEADANSEAFISYGFHPPKEHYDWFHQLDEVGC